MEKTPIEQFPALLAVPGLVHGFSLRVPGIPVRVDREAALQNLEGPHRMARESLELGHKQFVTGEQVHGNSLAVASARGPNFHPGVDGLLSADPGTCLGIYVADCCAVYIADPRRRVIALLHSGRRGTELRITQTAIEKMKVEFGCEPAGLIVQLSPCIRSCHYESDIPAAIIQQCRDSGVKQVHDCGVCTGCEVDRYYSYRVEQGKTGRMLAFLSLD